MEQILSPKQTRRPLPCLLIISFFYGAPAWMDVICCCRDLTPSKALTMGALYKVLGFSVSRSKVCFVCFSAATRAPTGASTERKSTAWTRQSDIGSALDILGRGPGFESGFSHNDPDALQDHCDKVENLNEERETYPWGKKKKMMIHFCDLR